jgi:hypothetical protein
MKNVFKTFCLVVLLSGLAGISYAQDEIAGLKEKIISIQNKSALGFSNFHLCTNILGYGQYVALESNKIKAGSTVKIYYEPTNLFTAHTEGGYKIWFTQDIVLKSAEGEELYKQENVLNFNYQTTSPIMDIFGTNSLDLGALPPGPYLYEVIVHDKLKNAQANYALAFEVEP